MYTLRTLAYEFEHEYTATKKLKMYMNILDKYKGLDWCWKTKHNFEGEYNKLLIFKNKFFDIYLIVWKPHADIGYHDHGQNGCLFKILQGSLEEIQKTNSQTYQSKECKEKNTYYIDNDIGIHCIKNNNDAFTYSLHIYSPPNYKCHFFT